MTHSTSDQTGMKQFIPSLEKTSANNKNSIFHHENQQNFQQVYSDANWQKFWPKHSSTSETFFRFNAKYPLNDDRIPTQNIPEHIELDCDKEQKTNLTPDALTTYLEKEKLRPKVILIYVY